MDRLVTDEMVPALAAEPGFAGALNLVDRDSGDAMMIVLWDSEPQARRALAEYGGAFLKALAERRGDLHRHPPPDLRLGSQRARLTRARPPGPPPASPVPPLPPARRPCSTPKETPE